MLQVKSKKLQHPKKKNFLLVLVPIHVLTISIPLFSGQNLNFHRPHTKKNCLPRFSTNGRWPLGPQPCLARRLLDVRFGQRLLGFLDLSLDAHLEVKL
jgi:hypothetical protein